MRALLTMEERLQRRLSKYAVRKGKHLIWRGTITNGTPRMGWTTAREGGSRSGWVSVKRVVMEVGGEGRGDGKWAANTCKEQACVRFEHLEWSTVHPITRAVARTVQQTEKRNAKMIDDFLVGQEHLRLFNEKYCQVALAKKYGLSRERVRQILTFKLGLASHQVKTRTKGGRVRGGSSPHKLRG